MSFLTSALSWVQSHGLALTLPAFTVASIVVTGVANVFRALGKTAPSWLGSASTFIGNVLHFMNGNVTLK